MPKFLGRFFVVVLLLLIAQFFATKHVLAVGTILNASDTISTSRPSASAPLNTAQAANDTNVSVVDNGSIFLASDSANFWPDTGETGNYGINVGTMSAQISGSPNTRTIYFTQVVPNLHHKGDAVYVPITAMHKIQFKTSQAVTATTGHIIITFPGSGSNIASPSASTFSFNGLATGQIQWNGVTCSSVTVTAPTIDCTVNGSGVAAATVITVLIGCTAGTTSCTTQAPRLINPTKSSANSCNNAATTCTADTWKVLLKTTDGTNDLDTGSVRIGTDESVRVSATVEPSLSYTIQGLANGTNFNTITGCGAETTNAGIDATATNVNLGTLANGVINLAGQKITVSTNGSTGYVITATSSGRLINADTGFWLPDANGGNGLTAVDTPIPATFGASGTADWGINACGTNSTAQWSGSSTTGFSSGAKYSNPWNTTGNYFYNTITSATGAVSSDVTGIRYGATIGPTTPAGIYSTVLTYVVTATF